MKNLMALAVVLVASLAQANDDRVGIATGDIHSDQFHFGPSPNNAGYAQIASTGAVWIRWDLGIVDITPTLNAEKLAQMQNGKAAGLKNDIIVRGPSPSTWANPYDPTLFSQAVATFVQQYGPTGTITPGLIDAIEVLNEPNNFWPGWSGATATTAAEQSLVAFSNAVADAVHAVSPTTPVIGLGTQGQTILDMIAMGLHLDGITFHPNGSTDPANTFEPPYTDFETFLAAVQAATKIPIWLTEIDRNVNDAYQDCGYLMAHCLMTLGNGVAHWFPYGWTFNADATPNSQQVVQWTNLDPRLSYYALKRLFGPGGLMVGATAAGKPTITGGDANSKGYVFQASTQTLCGLWEGNTTLGYTTKTDATVNVSFQTTLTNVAGSYVMNMVSGQKTPVTATVSSGIATVTGIDLSTEPNLIVLAAGSAPTPTPTPTPVPTPTPTPTPTFVVQRVTKNYGGSLTGPYGLALTQPQKAGDWLVATVSQSTGVTVGDSWNEQFIQAPTGTWTATGIKAETWNNVSFNFSVSTLNPVMTVTEYSFTPPTTPPPPTPTPTPTPPPPPTGIQPTLPAGVLPAGYTLKWNQDFTQPSYSPFNQASIVSIGGPPNSIWNAVVGQPGGFNTTFNATTGAPFSCDSNGLKIHADGTLTPPSGGLLSSVAPSYNAPPGSIVPGFWAADGYWEIKAFVPAQGPERWMSVWVIGSTASYNTANNRYGEVDMLEFPTCQQNLHSYPVDPATGKATGENDNPYSFNPPIPSVGWHVWGCLIQPGIVSIYIDGVLSHQFTGLTGEWNVPMQVNLDNSFGPGFPATGSADWTNDLGIQYVRCWAQ